MKQMKEEIERCEAGGSAILYWMVLDSYQYLTEGNRHMIA